MDSDVATLLSLPNLFLTRLDMVWTFLLLITRFTAFFALFPGIGMGPSGVAVRLPAILIFSFAAMLSSAVADLPSHWGLVVGGVFSEMIFGLGLALMPALIVAGFQTGGQLSSTSMGLGQAQLIDPTFGTSVSEISRLLGDLATLVFLLLGGHYVAIHAVGGLSGSIIPGTFLIGEHSMELLLDRAGDVFRVGMLISAPVVVALLITQFVMGLISKMVPTINIFILSFPITVGIGLFLTILSLPNLRTFAEKEIAGLENSMHAMTLDAQSVLKDKRKDREP